MKTKNDKIQQNYIEVNNDIEGIAIFDGNIDKALDEARADAVEQILGELQEPIEDVINNFEYTSEDDPLADAIIRLNTKFEALKRTTR